MARIISIENEAYDVSHIHGEIIENELMSQHTTWKVGGQAKLYFIPENVDDLQNFIKLVNSKQQHNILWLGLGSNVLIRDKGFNGIIINTVGKLKQIEIIDDIENTQQEKQNNRLKVSAESGVSCAKFSREVANAGLLGAEFYSGIPGSMGGAIAMNAGAFGGECWENIDHVETIDDQGNINKREKAEFAISYRQVKGLKQNKMGVREWFIKGVFNYPKNKQQVIQSKQKIKKLLAKRNQTQPVQYANAGSVFKNPPGDYAARLIEACHLKGKVMGGAVVSEKHANFIINDGSARASDIECLIEYIQKQVFQRFAISLQTEVRIYGQK